MERLYIRVDEASSGAVQEVLFDMGVVWNSGETVVLYPESPLLLVEMRRGRPRLLSSKRLPEKRMPIVDLRGTRDALASVGYFDE